MGKKPKDNLLDSADMQRLLHNATPAHLIDLVAEARNDKKKAEEAEKFLMEALKARLVDKDGIPTPMTDNNKDTFAGKTFKGELFEVTFKYVTQLRLDGEAIRTNYPEIADECSKHIGMIQASFKPLDPSESSK